VLKRSVQVTEVLCQRAHCHQQLHVNTKNTYGHILIHYTASNMHVQSLERENVNTIKSRKKIFNCLLHAVLSVKLVNLITQFVEAFIVLAAGRLEIRTQHA